MLYLPHIFNFVYKKFNLLIQLYVFLCNYLKNLFYRIKNLRMKNKLWIIWKNRIKYNELIGFLCS